MAVIMMTAKSMQRHKHKTEAWGHTHTSATSVGVASDPSSQHILQVLSETKHT